MGNYDWIPVVYEKGTFVAFDTETTGLKPEENRVVEIGAVKFDKSGEISRFSVLINPECPMPEEAGAVNNITDEMLKGKPLFKDVAIDFLKFIENTVLVAHNATFDIAFINAELKRCQIGRITNKFVDTLIFTREVFPRLESYKLQELAKRFEIVAFSAHRAEDDARVCMEVFHHVADKFIASNQDMISYWEKQFNIDDYIKTKRVEICEGAGSSLF